jgi:hypothetical protein
MIKNQEIKRGPFFGVGFVGVVLQHSRRTGAFLCWDV